MPRTIDIAAQIPHHPLRVFVMGDRGINREAATEDDIVEMRRLTEAALRAGAFGFTTSRTYSHKTNAGDLVPGHFAEEVELYGIGQAMASVGNGAFGMNSDFIDEDAEFAWMTRLSKGTGRPVWFLLTDRVEDAARWKRLINHVHTARAKGAQITAQVAGRPVGIIQGIAGSFNRSRSARAIFRSSDCHRASGWSGCATPRCAAGCSTRNHRSDSWLDCRRRGRTWSAAGTRCL
jgi:N-acyl-D-aspartate/D-glutamate deacylase